MTTPRASVLLIFALAAALLVPTAEAKEYKLKTRHYTIRTDVSPAFAKELARTMEGIYSGYRDRLKTLGRNRKGRHTVLVFNQRAAYLGFVGPQYASSGGIYMPSMNALATYLSEQPYERMTETLKHEGFHQFLHAYVRGPVAVWANEGLAQVFESAIRKDTGYVIGDAPHWRVRHIRKAVKDDDAFDLEDLFTLDHDQWASNMSDPTKGLLEYNQSWSVIHFLAYAKNAKYRKHLMAYLRLFDKKADEQTAFKRVFGRDTSGFTKAWKSYVLNELQPSSRAVDVAHLRLLGQMLGNLAKREKTPETMTQLHELFERGEARIPARGGLHGLTTGDDAENLFTSPEDPRAKDAGDKKPDKPILSYLLEEPGLRADPAWPVIRCTHHKRFDLIARHRRIGKTERDPVILEVLQTRKKIIRKPAS